MTFSTARVDEAGLGGEAPLKTLVCHDERP
jgi:hypothetical protein